MSCTSTDCIGRLDWKFSQFTSKVDAQLHFTVLVIDAALIIVADVTHATLNPDHTHDTARHYADLQFRKVDIQHLRPRGSDRRCSEWLHLLKTAKSVPKKATPVTEAQCSSPAGKSPDGDAD
jgi:hypothetical protein